MFILKEANIESRSDSNIILSEIEDELKNEIFDLDYYNKDSYNATQASQSDLRKPGYCKYCKYCKFW